MRRLRGKYTQLLLHFVKLSQKSSTNEKSITRLYSFFELLSSLSVSLFLIKCTLYDWKWFAKTWCAGNWRKQCPISIRLHTIEFGFLASHCFSTFEEQGLTLLFEQWMTLRMLSVMYIIPNWRKSSQHFESTSGLHRLTCSFVKLWRYSWNV